ncbi:MAG TPA: type I-F CRISPR-associated endonuclease Cas1 [Sulfurivirga caldicuralii]|nr:type I-F CRISPR-associated endonuclease Cas1 [Sulfurivirga caldicuralii]
MWRKKMEILFTHRQEMLYLEHARVRLENDRVVYDMDGDKEALRYNFPYKNAQVLMLGTGTSITQAAMKKLSLEGVIVVFSGSEGLPFYMASVSEYRPSKYAIGWITQWLDTETRMALAQAMLVYRLDFTRMMIDAGLCPLKPSLLEDIGERVHNALDQQSLRGIEGEMMRNRIYKSYARHYLGDNTAFVRDGGLEKSKGDEAAANVAINHGNSLAYGVAAGALWSLGIPTAFPVLHGTTRNGGLIFDVADLIKDGLVLPWAFENRNVPIRKSIQDLRWLIKKHKADKFMVETLKTLAVGA